MRLRLAAVLLGWIACGGITLAGQGDPDRPSDAPAELAEASDVARAPVVIDGESLFVVRGVSSFPAERRAAEIEARIRALAKDPAIGPSSFAIEEHSGATWILANGRRVLAVLDQDGELLDRHPQADFDRERLWGAIVAYRAARQPAALLRSALSAAGATVGLLVIVYLGSRLVRRSHVRLHGRYRQRVRDFAIQSIPIVKAEHLWRILAGAVSLLWVVTLGAVLFAYLRYTLALFPWTRGIAYALGDLVANPVRRMALGAIDLFPNVVFLAILALATRYLLSLVRLFFEALDTGSVRLGKFEPEWAWPTHKLVRALIVAFALVVAYPYLPGSHTDAFKGITLFLGIMVSLGSSSLVGNILTGYSMMYRRTFHVGDRVRIGEHVGEVLEIRLLATHLRSIRNEEVIVANSAILSGDVLNYSSMARERGLILHTTVGIGYETPWRQVEAMLLEAAARTPGLLRDRPPFVRQLSLGDFCVTYELNAYCDAPEQMLALYTDLHRNVLDLFNEYGVQIMTPAYEGDPEQPKVVPKERWFEAPAQRPATPARDAVERRG